MNKAFGSQATLGQGAQCLPGTAGVCCNEAKIHHKGTKLTKEPRTPPPAGFIGISVNFVSLW
jgi:hypothetical protein